MTKFESRVKEVVRREIESLQQQMLDLEAAPDLELETAIDVISQAVLDIKDEMMNYFDKVIGDLATVKKSTKEKGKTTENADFQQLNDHCDRVLIQEVLQESLSPRPHDGPEGAIRYGGLAVPSKLMWVLSNAWGADPDVVDMAKRVALTETFKNTRESLTKMDKVQSKLRSIASNIESVLRDVPSMIASLMKRTKDLESKVDDGNACCSSQTQFLENVLYPEVLRISGGSGSTRNDLSVIKGQLNELRRLLR